MTRKEIRDYIRILADEKTEAPEGLFKDTELNTLINLAIHNVQLNLMRFYPAYFRKTKTFNTTAATRTITIDTTLALTDFMLVEEILRNTNAERAIPLVNIEPDQLADWSIEPDDTGEPRVWYYEDDNTIAFGPIPDAAYSLKMFYTRRIPDLNSDTTHTPASSIYAIPSLPKETHPIIAYEALKLWHVRDEEEYSDLDGIIQTEYKRVIPIFSQRQGLTWLGRPGVREKIALE